MPELSSWNCSRGQARDSVDLKDDRGTLQGQMCMEKDPQGLVYSALERVAVPRHPSLSEAYAPEGRGAGVQSLGEMCALPATGPRELIDCSLFLG